MTDWKRSSALQIYRKGAHSAGIEGPGFCIRELPFRGKILLQIRGPVAAACEAVRQVPGLDLPLSPNTCIAGKVTVMCLGPRKWLFLLDSVDCGDFRLQLDSALSGTISLVSECSDARVGIQVSGAHARALLASVCALDLDSCSFGPGRCAQSQLARVPLLLYQLDELPTFHLYVDRSLARYAWDWLTDAADDFINGPIAV